MKHEFHCFLYASFLIGLASFRNLFTNLVLVIMSSLKTILCHKRRLVTSDVLFFTSATKLFRTKFQRLTFKCSNAHIFSAVFKQVMRLFTEFFIIKTFIATVCDYIQLLFLKICFKNRNYRFFKFR